MKPSKKRILTLNGGSSSIKFAMFEFVNSLQMVYEGTIERIGLPNAIFHVKDLKETDHSFQSVVLLNMTNAVTMLIDWIEEHSKDDALTAIGHRVVHGGPKYHTPQLITTDIITELQTLSQFDPAHMPQEILLIEAFQRKFPDLPQIACFDTAFHHDMPIVAKRLPIPSCYEAKGVRRYGFHGLSYEFLMEELNRLTGIEVTLGKVILAHLGNGASLAAVKNGKSIDTSMSFTPTSGIPMSTRSGDLDPGIGWYLEQTMGIDTKQFNQIVNSQSGLLGISETSSDMRDLLTLEAEDIRAAHAVAIFCYQIKKWIGSFSAALCGLNTLVFTGGIGENAPIIRSRICDGLNFLGIQLDEKRNMMNESIISAENSHVTVRVIHTNEELMVAKLVCSVLNLN